MNRFIFGFITFILLFSVSPRALFAQTTASAPDQRFFSELTRITPTPTAVPTPTTTPTGSPTSTPTPAAATPTPAATHTTPNPTVEPTSQPAVKNAVINAEPSPTPLPPAPQPPAKIAKPIVTFHSTPASVATTIGKYLTVPFAISMHYLPKDAYTEAGLSPQANGVLLFLALMSFASGIVLLVKPAVMKWADKQQFTFASKQTTSDFTIPRIAFPS